MTRFLARSTAAAVLALTGPLAFSSAMADAKPYRIDPSHAAITFTVTHVGFSETLFQFRDFDADILFDPDDLGAASNRVDLVIDAASLDSNWPRRDDHVRGDDFLDVESFPEIRFTSTGVEPTGESELGQAQGVLFGDLTIRDVTLPQQFQVTMNRKGEMRGTEVVGFTATGVIDRTDYGIEFGAPAIGAELQVWISLEINPS